MLAHEEKLKKAIDHIVEGLTPTEHKQWHLEQALAS